MLSVTTNLESTNKLVLENSTTIKNLKDSNDILQDDNIFLKSKISSLKTEINEIQQYLRVNNLEVVGLPVPDDVYSDEDNLIRTFNLLSDDVYCKNDIDISHVVPSRRNDGKRVVICKFVSRKKKFSILNSKKAKRDLKLDDNLIFINEHLSGENRKLFAMASERKKLLEFKYLWTKNNGSIYMRKNDGSPPISITCEGDLPFLNPVPEN